VICRRNRRSSFDLEETDKRGRTRVAAAKALSRFTTRVAGRAWLVPSSADAVDRGARSGLGGALRFTWKNVETSQTENGAENGVRMSTTSQRAHAREMTDTTRAFYKK
jgi:hypothetical protein